MRVLRAWEGRYSPVCSLFGYADEKRGNCGKAPCVAPSVLLAYDSSGESVDEEVGRVPKGRGAAKKVSCDECYFRCNLLCALNLDEPCATFRPDHPDGLRPPRQLRFTFRQERRTPAAWAFPSADEQAALHR
jgi:hypothetical protein